MRVQIKLLCSTLKVQCTKLTLYPVVNRSTVIVCKLYNMRYYNSIVVSISDLLIFLYYPELDKTSRVNTTNEMTDTKLYIYYNIFIW